MIVKLKGKQLSFLFQEEDPFFEMGHFVLNQEHIAQMISYKRTIQNGKEKLIFDADGYELLSEAINSIPSEEIINIIYAMIFMVEKVEENGFLKKECIWFDYNHIFYDPVNKKPMFAVLPISQEVKRSDKKTWMDAYNYAILQVSKHLDNNYHERIMDANNMWETGQLGYNDMLESVNELGCGESGLLVDRTKKEAVKTLSLIHQEKDGQLLFDISENGFVLGRKSDEVDGSIEISKAVSRKHCKIIKQKQKYFVQDLDSTNHTLVNGINIPAYEIMELMDNDILSVADVDFRVRIQALSE